MKKFFQRVDPAAKPGDVCLRPAKYSLGGKTFPADEGILIVPECRSKASSRRIALPLIRVRSRNPQPREPVFWLEGGPGASNMEFQIPEWLLADHDVVMVGYRGVDGSSVLACPEINRAFRGKGGDLLGRESLENIHQAIKRASCRLQGEGIDLEGYSIPEVVGDLEVARIALGYEGIHLLSVSYGTRVAQVFAYLHPESIRRSVMIGVNPPGHFVWEPEMIDSQLRYYSALWAQNPQQAARCPDLAGTLRGIMRDFPKHWLLFPIDQGKVRLMTFAMLFQRGSAAVVFDAFLAAERGDPSGLWMMSMACDFLFPNMLTWGHLFAQGASADYDPNRDYSRELGPSDSILGSPISLAIWGAAGDAWPVHLIPSELRRVQPSDVPTLLVSGSVDFSTPAEFATRELLPSLKNGHQVILRECGHVSDILAFHPQALQRLISGFLDRGEADDSLFSYKPMDFHISFGFPILAKIVLALGLIMVAALMIGLLQLLG